MAGTLERARAAVVASPELRLWAERGRSLLYGPAHDAPVRHSEVSPWRPPQGSSKRAWQTVLSALSGFLGGLIIAASVPVWYLAPESWRITLPGVPHPGTTAESTAFFLVGLILLALGWLGLVHRAGARRQHPQAPRDGRGRDRHLGDPRVARPAAALQRRLQLCRPGRDGQPRRRPQLHRAGRHRSQRLVRDGRSDLAGVAGALRPGRRRHQPCGRRGRGSRPCHLDLALPGRRGHRRAHGGRRDRPRSPTRAGSTRQWPSPSASGTRS